MATLTELLLSGNYVLAARALVIDADLETVLHEVPLDVLDGSVSIDRTREVPRLGDVRLRDDGTGLYQARSSSSLTWAGRLWRLERGAYVDGVAQYVPLITGPITRPPREVQGQLDVAFQISSRLRLLNANFPSPLVITAGTRASDVVLAVGALGGLGTDPALYVLEDAGRVALADRSFTEDENMLRTLHEWLYSQGLTLTDDGLGRTVLYPFVDPSATPAQWTFDATSDQLTTYVERAPQAPEQFYNRANVVGVAPDRYPVEAEARDLNPLSPTYNPPDGSGPLGDRPRPRYVSADIHDQLTANEVALRLLYEGGLFEEGVILRAVPVPGVEASHVARIVGASADDNYLLDTVTMPLRGGEMSAGTKRLRSLVAP